VRIGRLISSERRTRKLLKLQGPPGYFGCAVFLLLVLLRYWLSLL
jgi:hypothetical protein